MQHDGRFASVSVRIRLRVVLGIEMLFVRMFVFRLLHLTARRYIGVADGRLVRLTEAINQGLDNEMGSGASGTTGEQLLELILCLQVYRSPCF